MSLESLNHRKSSFVRMSKMYERTRGKIWNLTGNEDRSGGSRCWWGSWNSWYLAVIAALGFPALRYVWSSSMVRWEKMSALPSSSPWFCWHNTILKREQKQTHSDSSSCTQWIKWGDSLLITVCLMLPPCHYWCSCNTVKVWPTESNQCNNDYLALEAHAESNVEMTNWINAVHRLQAIQTLLTLH